MSHIEPDGHIAPRARPPFECVALLLQGGGALGAYQAGVYQAMAEADLHPDWVAGISIGAINAAIIAGNPPGQRVEKLSAFWTSITTDSIFDWNLPFIKAYGQALYNMFGNNEIMRGFWNEASAGSVLTGGASGFFSPRMLPPWFSPSATMDAISFYDTAALKGTLEQLVDFDRINAAETRLSIGAVDIELGNLRYFDNVRNRESNAAGKDRIGPEHIMASGALPPGFPPVAIPDESGKMRYYWDGGLVSNTPLQWVFDQEPRMDTLAFQIDLWSARGMLPSDIADVIAREKEVRFSSRTRAATELFRRLQILRRMTNKLMSDIPDSAKRTEEGERLSHFGDDKVYTLVHLIYRSKTWETQSKDYEFSGLSMRDHWRAGYEDAARALGCEDIYQRPTNLEGLRIFDGNVEQAVRK
jgi:NTE family protein